MKLVRLVVWGVLAAILIILLILGLTGNLSSVFPNIDIPFNIGGSFSYPDSELYTVGPGSVDTGAVSDIYINWADGEVNVVEYSGNDIQFSESASYDLEPNEEMRYLVRNGKLTIQFCAPGKYSILNNIRGKSLTVYVPIGFEMDNFKVDSVSASVNVENVKAIKTVLDSVSGRIYAYGVYSDSIRLDTVSGKITVEECVVESVTSDTTSGVIELRGEFEEVKCDSVSGSIFVSPDEDIKKVTLESVSGKVTVEIPEINGFTAKYDSVSGGFNCEFPAKISKHSATYGDGSASFRLDTVSGSINIKMK